MAGALERFDAAGPERGAAADRRGLVVAHCASGLRSAMVWAAASARSQSVDCVLAALRRAGFYLDVLRDDLEQQADRRRWLGAPQALDCTDRAVPRMLATAQHRA